MKNQALNNSVRTGSPMQANYASPLTKKGIYKTFNVDGEEKTQRITREEADKIKDTETILETGADITVDKPVEIVHKGDDEQYWRDVEAQNKRIAAQKKGKAAKKVKDLDTGEIISSEEDQRRQANLKKTT